MNKQKIIKPKLLRLKTLLPEMQNNTIWGILISWENVNNFANSQYIFQKDINVHRILANSIPDINIYLSDRDFRIIFSVGSEMKKNGLIREHFEGKTLAEIENKRIREIWKPNFSATLSQSEIQRGIWFDKGQSFSLQI
ncbi:MAG: hypothetical protein P1P88_12135 [Bacteroidales bacterium]|nr:hypothetical protein [Bacteroidales bacterium]